MYKLHNMRGTMPRVLFPCLALGASFLAACTPTTIPTSLESPGIFPASARHEKMSNAESALRNVLKAAGQEPEAKLLRVGHVLGAYREYAMVVDKDGAQKHTGNVDGPAQDMVPLLERAFQSFELNSVELDVHVAPPNMTHLNPEEIVVVHNSPDWREFDRPSAGMDYLKRNTFRTVLDAFLAKGYGKEGGKLYIEVKAPPVCELSSTTMPSECSRIGRAIAKTIMTTKAEMRPSLAFISFWPKMLEAVHTGLVALGADADVHEYVLILGPSSAFWAHVGSGAKGNVPQFDDERKVWLEKTPWVDAVWASPSPRISPKLGEDMANINRERLAHCATCLNVGVSVYQSNPDAFEEHLRTAWSATDVELPACGRGGKKAPAIIESLIYDIDTDN